MKVSEKLEIIQNNILHACHASGRNPEEVKIIAVTKYVDVKRAAEVVEAGVTHIGENRDDGLLSKWNVLKDKPNWHFIGTLQTRKVKNIIDKIDYIHSLDRMSLAAEINKRANRKINCLIQINVSGEETKHGIDPDKVVEFVHSLKEFPNITVVGLMTMAPFTANEEEIRTYFKDLKNLQKEVQGLKLEFAPCTELSMGMSNDYMIAVEEGATMVRIGTALVGEETEVQG